MSVFISVGVPVRIFARTWTYGIGIINEEILKTLSGTSNQIFGEIIICKHRRISQETAFFKDKRISEWTPREIH